MKDAWNLYETLLGKNSAEDRREITIEEAVESFTNGMVDDPAYQKNASVEGEITPLIVSRTSTIKASLKAAPGTKIHIGDIVKCLGETWIVTELHIDKVGIINGEMWICNDQIAFQNHSSTIHTRHCVVDNGNYSKATKNSEVRSMENTYEVYLSMDAETTRMFVDKRLSLGKIFSSDGTEILEVYKIIGIDVKSKNYGVGSHLMVLTLQRDVYDPESDDISLNICDKFKNTNDDAVIENGEYKVEIIGSDALRIGRIRTYKSVFYKNNVEQLNVEPKWNIICPDKIKYKAEGQDCTIDVPLNGDLVGETVTIELSDREGLYPLATKEVQVITVG